MTTECFEANRRMLEEVYAAYDDPSYVHPDPLEHVLLCKNMHDAEVTGLIASSFAYGRVQAILSVTSRILDRMDRRPFEYLSNSGRSDMAHDFSDLKYRFTTGEETVNFLVGVKMALEEYGSLRDCFESFASKGGGTYAEAALSFSERIRSYSGTGRTSLLPVSGSDSPCKRLMLFLRWMVRKDNVDPGWWEGLDRSRLIVPLDTHMMSIGRGLGLTGRKNASMKTAMEITASFARFCPEDPVKYDFCLTRSGIRGDDFMGEFREKWIGNGKKSEIS